MGENYITCQAEKGSINISEEVLVSMVRAAINEIDGVASLANNAGNELAELLGIKSATRGLKVQINDGVITVDTIIMVRYGQCRQCGKRGAGQGHRRCGVHDRYGQPGGKRARLRRGF